MTVFAPDVLRDRYLYNYNRTYPVWALASLLLPGLLGFAIGGSLAAAFSGFVFGGTGAGIHRQSGRLVRRVHQSHDRFEAVRHGRQQRQQLAGRHLYLR